MKKSDAIDALILKIKENEFLAKDQLYLLHAVLYTVDIEELVESFLISGDKFLRKYLISNIQKRLDDRLIDKVMLYKYLMDVLKKENGATRVYQRARMLMRLIFSYLPNDLKKEFYEYFINSKYIHDRDLAISVSTSVWDSSFGKIYISLFLECRDYLYLEKVLENGCQEDIVDELEVIWRAIDQNKYKSLIIDFLLPKYFENFLFLKEVDPASYLHVLARSDHNILSDFSDETLDDILCKLKEQEFIFGLWCIGRICRWNILQKHVSAYI